MIVYIKLDDIDLIKRIDEEGATVEIRSVHEIQVSARRKVIELPVPGSQSNIFQDMGRDPRCLRLEGRLIGKGAPDTLKTIRTKFNSGELIPFSSDLWAIEDITTVIFEGFSVRVHDGIPLEIRYTMLLREAKPPPEEGAGEKGAPTQKGEADKEVEEKTKEITKEKEGGGKEGEGGKEGGKEEEGKEKTKEKEGAPEGKVGSENGAAEAAPKGGEEAGIKSDGEGGGKAYSEKDEVMKGEEGKDPGEKEEVKGRGGESESGSLEDEGGASESGGREGEKGAEKSGRAKSEKTYADDKGGGAAPGEDGGFKGGLFEPTSQDSTKEDPKKAPEKGT